MSRRQDQQSAEGIMLRAPAYGVLDYVSKSAPAGGEVGFATGCTWRVPTGTGTVNQGYRYVNIGSNGFYTNLTTQNPKALWIEDDATGNAAQQFGNSTATFLGSGNVYRNILTVANGVSPSATGADKIVDKYSLPANAFDVAGRGLQITVWGTAASNGNNKRFKVYFGATNVSTVLTNGTVTVTGGTVIIDSTTLTTNNGAILVQGQIFKTGAAGSNTQESMTTSIIGGSSHSGVGAWTDQSFTEANAFLIVVTAQATTTATDIVYQGCEITAFN